MKNKARPMGLDVKGVNGTVWAASGFWLHLFGWEGSTTSGSLKGHAISTSPYSWEDFTSPCADGGEQHSLLRFQSPLWSPYGTHKFRNWECYEASYLCQQRVVCTTCFLLMPFHSSQAIPKLTACFPCTVVYAEIQLGMHFSILMV